MQVQHTMSADWRAQAPIQPPRPAARRARLVFAYGMLGAVSALGLLLSSDEPLAERWDQAQAGLQQWWQGQVGPVDAQAAAVLAPPSDAKLSAHLLRALANEPEFASLPLELRVDGGVVTLRGNLPDPAQRERLERRILTMPGVKVLHSQIGVPEPQLRVSTQLGPRAEP